MSGRIGQCDSLEFMKKQEDFSADIIYCDPPYALGSEVIIRKDGKPDYKKAVDFMNKWDMPNGDYWEAWFKEAFRVLKYGGRVIMFGMDRQLMLNKYYACYAGFEEQQSLYWYFISNFPKATDLSKMIDRNAGAGREVVGITSIPNGKESAYQGERYKEKRETAFGVIQDQPDKTAPFTELAKKYEGYKYSISPLKQTNETIMVFQKPYKTGSCLHDTFAYENGDRECLCGALNIEGNRVGFASNEDEAESKNKNQHEDFGTKPMTGNNVYGDFSMIGQKNYNPPGRYPSQTFIECICDEVVIKKNEAQPYSYSGKEYQNKETSMFNGDKPQAPSNYNDKGSGQIHTNPNCPCARLDLQSGELQKGKGDYVRKNGAEQFLSAMGQDKTDPPNKISDTGGCSKILHKCEFDEEEHDIYFYFPKVSKAERNGGLEELSLKGREPKGNNQGVRYCKDCGLTDNGTNNHNNCSGIFEYKLCQSVKNNHPTLKPIALNKRILSLFKTPNGQKILYPFAGTFSEVIGGYLAGFTNFEGCELKEEWITIGEARFSYWTNREKKEAAENEDQFNLFTQT